MEMIPVVLYFNGKWNENNEYNNFEAIGMLFPSTCSFEEFQKLICSSVRQDYNRVKLSIKFKIRHDIAWITVYDEATFRFFVEVSRKSDEQCQYPLIIEKVFDNGGVPIIQQLRNEDDVIQAVAMSYSTQPNSDLTPWEFRSYADRVAEEIIEREKEMSLYQEESDEVISEPNIFDVKVHQLYKDKKVLEESIRLQSINQNRQYKVERKGSRDFVLVCTENDKCKWKLRASKFRKTNFFKVREFVDSHTCSSNVLMVDHRQANSEFVSECIMHKLTNLRRVYTPADIVEDMMTEFNMSISYQKAWRSKERALEKVRGNPHDYSIIPSWLYMLKKTNSGSFTSFELERDGSFKYLFFAIGASIEAWRRCFPIMVIDGTFMHSNYGGTLLIASTQDANKNIVPVAFAVVDSENEDSWKWFFINLRQACGGVREGQCIVFDRHEAIIQGMNNVFPDVMHGSCTYHVLKDIKNRFKKKGEQLKNAYNGVCKAYTIEQFNSHMAVLDEIDVRIRKYLEEEVLLERCTRLYEKVSRYSTMTSNTAESVNNAIKGIRGLPVTALIESLRCLVQRWYFSNKEAALSTFTKLSTTDERRLLSNINKSRKLKVESSNLVIFTVYEVTKQFVVDMEQRTCTCKQFQYHEMSCKHAVAVISKRHLDFYEFCSRFYSSKTLVDTYSTFIMPLDDKENWEVPTEIREICVLPPNTRRPAGRPKAGRYKHYSEIKIQNRCSWCQEKGHNRKTCKNPVVYRQKNVGNSNV